MSDNTLQLFLDALKGQNLRRPPVWLMRQAGRYMPEYRALREKYGIKELWASGELAVEVSLQPHVAFDVDAVIVFYDILLPVEHMGAPLDYTDTGPVFGAPIRDERALDTLRDLDVQTAESSLLEALTTLRREVGEKKAILGFAGAPFTLASYLIAGRVGQGVNAIKRAMFEAPLFLHKLLDRLTTMTVEYLGAQATAGAHVLQLFDSWAGHLGEREYREFVLPYHQRIFESMGSRGERVVPMVLYVGNSAHLLEALDESGADALSVDWRVSLDDARQRLGKKRTLQGNLDPAALYSTPEVVRDRTLEILRQRTGDPAYIFNLGHGVLPETPVECVRTLVETVKSFEP